ncbi:hypothetical protein VTN77DRAFT_5808 [Rasamsonia byssochlamydoides]|uniref:uncharacterized protein n=1 Tax=Rasamsonia byssochlamydoides TaxID=89139 RepID=UPI00374255C0
MKHCEHSNFDEEPFVHDASDDDYWTHHVSDQTWTANVVLGSEHHERYPAFTVDSRSHLEKPPTPAKPKHTRQYTRLPSHIVESILHEGCQFRGSRSPFDGKPWYTWPLLHTLQTIHGTLFET